MIKLYRSAEGYFVLEDSSWRYARRFPVDELFVAPDPVAFLRDASRGFAEVEPTVVITEKELLPPLDSQEIWAAGVTYYRSREARMEESEKSGGDVFYDRVYDAERPEIFFKGGRSRTVGHRQKVVIRADSHWNVPEPEVALAVNSQGHIFGYTIGNDMSSRDIEGENPLYLPQAKVYRGCCAIGPALVVADSLDSATTIALTIERDGCTEFDGRTSLRQLKRSFATLVEYLFRENVFPFGAYLLTGAGVVPGGDFSLQSGDRIIIKVDTLGVLENEVE